MASIRGYKYTTESDAQNAVSLCNQYYGIPKADDDITENWVMYRLAEFNKPTFYYLTYDESLQPILGNPTSFNVIEE